MNGEAAELAAYRNRVRALVEQEPSLFGDEVWDRSDRPPPVRAALSALGDAGLLASVIPLSGDDHARAVGHSAVLHREFAPLAAGSVVLTHTEVGSRILAAHPEPALEAVRAARAGRHLAALAVTEPGGGLDFGAMTTKAEAAGDALELSGEKWFSSNLPFADEVIVLAVDARTGTGPAARHSLVRVATDSPGVTVEPLDTYGHRGLTGRLRLDHVLVRTPAVLGSPGAGLLLLMRHWVHERVMLAVRMTAMAEWLTSLLTPSSARGHRTLLTGLAACLECERAACRLAVGRLAAGSCTMREAAGCKYRAGRLLRDAAEGVLMMRGLAGDDTTAAERVLRDATGLALAGGSEEALLMQVARSLR